VQVKAAVVVEDQRARIGRLRCADHSGFEQRLAQCVFFELLAGRDDVGEIGAHVSRGGGEARRARRRPQRGERVVRGVALAGPVDNVVGKAFGERLVGLGGRYDHGNAFAGISMNAPVTTAPSGSLANSHRGARASLPRADGEHARWAPSALTQSPHAAHEE
jgi:hypothetical protein